PPTAFLRHLAERLPPDRDPLGGIERAHVEDLYLACACARGDPRAVEHVDDRFLSKVGAQVARGSPSLADEVRQIMRERLMGSGGVPWIAGYSGLGALGGWLRISAVRVARDLQRAERRHVPLDSGVRAAGSAAADPELDYMKTRYADEFSAAFKT